MENHTSRVTAAVNDKDNTVCEKGRNETLHSLGELLLCDMEFLKASRRYPYTNKSRTNFSDNLTHRRASFIDFFKGYNRTEGSVSADPADSGTGDEVGVDASSGDGSADVREPLPDILTLQYKDVYTLDGGDSDREGVVTITPFVEIKKVRVASRGHTKFDESLKEIRERISKFDFERKFKTAAYSDDFQLFLGNRYLEMYDKRHGNTRREMSDTNQSRRHDESVINHPLSDRAKYDSETLDKSYALNAKIHALAKSKQKGAVPLARSASTIRLPPINTIALHAEGYDSSPEVTTHSDEKHVMAFDNRPTRNAHLRVPALHTALRARKRFPQHEKFRDLLHELRNLSKITQKFEQTDGGHYHSA